MSLKSKMTMLVSVLVACLLLLLTQVTRTDVEKQLKSSIAEQQGTLTSAMAKQLDYKIAIYRGELVQVSRTIDPGLVTDHARAARFLKERLDTTSMFDSGLFLASPQGRVLAATVPTLHANGTCGPFRSEIERTAKSGAPRISEPYFCDNNHHQPMVLFSTPVKGARGEVIAVLAGRLDLLKENFLGEVAQEKIGKRGYFFLVNRQRTLVVHPDRARMLTTFAPGANPGVDRAVLGAEGTFENTNSKGVKVLSTFRPLASTGWILSANFPLEEAYLPVGRIERRMFYAFLVMLGASVLVVWGAVSNMLRPLSSFTRQVANISGDDTVLKPVQIGSLDEIGELAASFNRLMGDIARHKGAIQAEKDFELSLLQHSSLPTFVLDREHRILHWNGACEALTGLAADKLLGASDHWRAFFETRRPTLADLVVDGAGEIPFWYPCYESKGDGFHAEGWYPQLNGADRYLSFYAAPIFGAGGALVAVIETVEDITARKKGEEEISHSVSLLNATLESTADGILVRDLEGRLVTYNRNFVEMWNLQQELLATRDDRENRRFALEQVKDPERLLRVTEMLYRHPERESQDILELKDGRVFERVSRPQRIGAQVVGRVVSYRDITERERSKEALWESISRYRSLVDNIDLGITLIDTDHHIVMTNATAARMFGRRPSELIGHHCFREFEQRATACRHCPGDTAMRTGRPATVQTDAVREDGGRMPVRIRAFPVEGADGRVTGFIEVIQDISEQLQAEADKQQLEAQLRQAQKMEALGTLTGGIAHDFNNMLTAIFAYCSLIERRLPAGTAAADYLHKLVCSAERASALTQSLLAYSRKQPIAPQPVELDEVIDKVTHLLSRLMGEDIQLSITRSGRPLTVMADGSQLGQVLMNLATNARDAMSGGGTLRISTRQIEVDEEFIRMHGFGVAGSYAALTVSDTGSGMDQATLERVFEPFFTTKEVGKGTGLGLSVAYGIVKQHQGNIVARSEPGRGTTFTIYLPLLQDEGKASAPPALPARGRGEETILLVEDDPEIRSTLRELLEEDGYTIIEAADGEEGMQQYRLSRERIQLLLLDMIMPRKNGKELYDEIREIDPDMRAVFMSGYTADILDEKGMGREEANIVFKPIAIGDLISKLREVLDHERLP